MSRLHNNDKSGFTLLEVVITVAILSMISIPLLMYFSNSAAFNAKARRQQAATLAARNTVEELKSAEFDISSPGAVVDSSKTAESGKWSAGGKTRWYEVSSSGETETYHRAVNVDGLSFLVEAAITPRTSVTSSTSAPDAATSTINYKKYSIGSMDKDTDIVATDNETNLAQARLNIWNCIAKYMISHKEQAEGLGLTGKDESVVKDSDIESHLKVSIIKSSDGKKAVIKMSKVYEYKGPSNKSFDSSKDNASDSQNKFTNFINNEVNDKLKERGLNESAFLSKSLSLDKLKENGSNIYLFYDPAVKITSEGTDAEIREYSDNGDRIEFDVDKSICNEMGSRKINFMLIRQDAGVTTGEANYKLTLDLTSAEGTLGDTNIVVRTNIPAGSGTITNNANVTLEHGITQEESGAKRLADVQIKVFKIDPPSEGGYNKSDLEGTPAESIFNTSSLGLQLVNNKF